jgi:2-dehydropantoate 2-reductase
MSKVNILVVGAGAIGGFLGAMLSKFPLKYRVALVARGAHYRAMKEHGGLQITINSESEKPEYFLAKDLQLYENLAQAENSAPYDIIFLAVKAHQLIDIAVDKSWKNLLHDRTILVPLQNGLPWYLFLVRPSNDKLCGTRLKSVDPTGELERAFASRRIVGCIAMPACTVPKPGYIEHEHGWAFPLPASEQAQFVAKVLKDVGFRPKCHDDFEAELWLKSLGSAIFNPVSALTGAVLGEFADDPRVVSLTYRIMDEVRSVAKAVGKQIPVSNEQRLKGATRIGHHKTSMLQDVEAGKSTLEIDALVSSVIEIAEITNTSVPTLSVIYDLIRMKQRALARAGQHPPKARL